MSLSFSSDMVTCTKSGTMIETNCAVTFQGKTFEAGGACLFEDPKTKKMKGILYAKQETNELTSWDGTFRIPAKFGHEFNGAFRDCGGWPQLNQTVKFTHAGKNFTGIWYNKRWSQIVRVKEARC